jgi:hypothetical protein
MQTRQWTLDETSREPFDLHTIEWIARKCLTCNARIVVPADLIGVILRCEACRTRV